MDLVITQGEKVWGVEVKASASVGLEDGKGLRQLAEKASKPFKGGIVIYKGVNTLRLGDDRLFAVPISEIFE